MADSKTTRLERRRRILEAGSLVRVLDYSDGEDLLRDEANDPDPSMRLVWPEHLEYLLKLRKEQNELEKRPNPSVISSDDVIIVPGFFASNLRDVSGSHGPIWIDAKLFDTGDELAALALDRFETEKAEREVQANPRIKIEANGPIPATVELLSLYLTFWRYAPTVFAFDWRRNLETAAASLADLIRARLSRPFRPLHIIAHSVGAVVARRALQILGTDSARRLVNNLGLLGPLSYGSYSPALVLAGDVAQVDLLRMYGIAPPKQFGQVLQSFTALYQLLPWRAWLSQSSLFNGFKTVNGIDPARLNYGIDWARAVETRFFNDRTTIVLGGHGAILTDAAFEFKGGKLVATERTSLGDGVVTDEQARLEGVRTYRLPGAEHSRLLLYPEIHTAIRAILKNEAPALTHPDLKADSTRLVAVTDEPAPPHASRPAASQPAADSPIVRTFARRGPPPQSGRLKPPAPACRRLRVFSSDPLLATCVEHFRVASLTLELPWDETLTPGPVGEYLEVIDYDSASKRFYHPVDLAHPRVIAENGLTPSESNPQFHQQMVYGVARATIDEFEKALGRVALWAPRLKRNASGAVEPHAEDTEFVPRLRLYPHGLREANAYYDPERHAILFGYFSSREQSGGQTIPGGTVFTCQSFDIIAHETTHALLHGLHRYYLYPSNRDVLAFHEAIADAVALFQKFGHEAVLEHQIARTRGDLRTDNFLGKLAMQFGAAMGDHRGALRQYFNVDPDPALLKSVDEPHDRGAILMAALFQSFLNIYENRTRDLYRIATNGTGKLPDGDIHPDLVCRLAREASRSARHVLRMCVRALDYVPPVDLTFGEFLRALITADFDLVRDDDRGYRVSVLNAFRSWGIYPADVNVLDESAILWDPPNDETADALSEIIRELDLTTWSGRPDRRTVYSRMRKNIRRFHSWLNEDSDRLNVNKSLGILTSGATHQSIPRVPEKDGVPPRPKFEIHSLRPCLRIGPDGQQCSDLVIEIVQRRAGFFDPKIQATVDQSGKPWAFSKEERAKTKRPLIPNGSPDFWFRGGSTLIIDQASGSIRYCIGKSILDDDEHRLGRQRAFERGGGFASPAATYFGSTDRNPFALLHSDHEDELYGS